MKLFLYSLLILSSISTTIFADIDSQGNHHDSDYGTVRDLIISEPRGESFLTKISEKEQNELLAIFEKDEQQGLFTKQQEKMVHDKIINDEEIESIFLDSTDGVTEIYKGDLHNDGTVVYEIFKWNDGARNDLAYFYKLENNHLIALNFNHIAAKQYGAYSETDNNIGNPLAPFVKDHKTYLRFLAPAYPLDEDVNNLKLRVYLWQGDVISNPGPNFEGGKLRELIKSCGGSALNAKRDNFKKLYESHQYSAAYNTLSTFITNCNSYYDNTDDLLQLQNDQLITLVHLNQKNQCTTLMNKMKSNASFNDMPKAFLKAAQFNFGKCAAL